MFCFDIQMNILENVSQLDRHKEFKYRIAR